MPAFSAPTITAIAEAVTGGSGGRVLASTTAPVGLYRTRAELVKFFRHLALELTIGSRVPAVEQLLIEVNARPDGLPILTRVIEQVADPREYLDAPEKLAAVVGYLNARLALDGCELRPQGQRHRLVRTAVEATAASALLHIEAFDLDSVQRRLRPSAD